MGWEHVTTNCTTTRLFNGIVREQKINLLNFEYQSCMKKAKKSTGDTSCHLLIFLYLFFWIKKTLPEKVLKFTV